MVVCNRLNHGYMVSYLWQLVEFVCLHHSLSTLSQSHKFSCQCPTSTRSRSPNCLNPRVGVKAPPKNEDSAPLHQIHGSLDSSKSAPKRHLDQLTHVPNTHRPHYMWHNRPHQCNACMWCGQTKNTSIVLWTKHKLAARFMYTSKTVLPVRRLSAQNSSSIEPAHAVHVSFSLPVRDMSCLTPYRKFTYQHTRSSVLWPAQRHLKAGVQIRSMQ